MESLHLGVGLRLAGVGAFVGAPQAASAFRQCDVRTVAHRLGHADPAMTLRVYAHAVERADEALA